MYPDIENVCILVILDFWVFGNDSVIKFFFNVPIIDDSFSSYGTGSDRIELKKEYYSYNIKSQRFETTF